jgi:hypothetical protein
LVLVVERLIACGNVIFEFLGVDGQRIVLQKQKIEE